MKDRRGGKARNKT